jgi:hypothetical protein
MTVFIFHTLHMWRIKKFSLYLTSSKIVSLLQYLLYVHLVFFFTILLKVVFCHFKYESNPQFLYNLHKSEDHVIKLLCNHLEKILQNFTEWEILKCLLIYS